MGEILRKPLVSGGERATQNHLTCAVRTGTSFGPAHATVIASLTTNGCRQCQSEEGLAIKMSKRPNDYTGLRVSKSNLQ